MSTQGDAKPSAQWRPPYLLYLGNAADDLAIKTARGVAYWRPEWCVGQLRHPDCKPTLGLPDMSMAEAKDLGANTMLIGTANAGGTMAPEIVAAAIEALDTGLNVVAGLHHKLRENPDIVAAAQRNGRVLFDARDPAPGIPVGNGRPRAGRRLLTVGTDCSVGKMYTTLALERAMRQRGLAADFRATGQTGIFVAGAGVPIDAVVADFISGGAEWISPARHDGGWDLIEGQGSLFHPSYAGVSLGLLHGSQPDALVLCHEPTRRHMRGLPDYPLPELKPCLEANLVAARLTNPAVKPVGVALNTSGMPAGEAVDACKRISDLLQLPCQDPVTMGVEAIVDQLLACFAN
ncbi:N-acetyltransferase DgcN [Rhodanobacter sp. Root179]|uniref:N-acetyltransferase DgcN n=1 Tax=Rhodanobacter sp. Root179 TaxID=1736482 RepID=UPI0006F7C9B3|nr:N-acetyltransferase DgcN [Rhodanobacter sp. Root179]KRB57134.1 EBNA-1 nuclear protein [Rhodanobacter sp. Root179]